MTTGPPEKETAGPAGTGHGGDTGQAGGGKHNKFSLLRKWLLLQAMIADRSVKDSDVRVAAALLDCLNSRTGRCDPSAGNIAARIKCDERTVQRSRANLVKAGWLMATRRPRTWQFAFAFDRIPEPTNLSDQKPSEPTNLTRQNCRPTKLSDKTLKDDSNLEVSNKDRAHARGGMGEDRTPNRYIRGEEHYLCPLTGEWRKVNRA